MAIADAAQERYGRSVAWGAACGDDRELFTNLSVPVMTRLRQRERLVLDTLVDAGVARSRSEALAWAVRLVGQHADEWLTELREAMASVGGPAREPQVDCAAGRLARALDGTAQADRAGAAADRAGWRARRRSASAERVGIGRASQGHWASCLPVVPLRPTSSWSAPAPPGRRPPPGRHGPGTTSSSPTRPSSPATRPAATA